MTRPVLLVADHSARADSHHAVADSLFATGEEWAAVCYFYASLHRLRAALLADPIFKDPVRLAAANRLLRPVDARCEKHVGYMRRRPGQPPVKIWGLTELVQILYPHVAVDYDILYNSSLDVRYHRGLVTVSLAATQAHANHIRQEYEAGRLVAP